jgi:hypothetical protein
MPPVPRLLLAAVIVTGLALALVESGRSSAEVGAQAPTEVAPSRTDTASAQASDAGSAIEAGPIQLVLPDSELVYGPSLYRFDVAGFVSERGGYLDTYAETVDGVPMSGSDIVTLVAEDYSVGPRVLLALIEAASGWVTNTGPADLRYPLGPPVPGLRDGLVGAADRLNAAYYAHRLEGRRSFTLADGTEVTLNDTSAGTFAVVAVTSHGATSATWGLLEGPSRLYAAWTALFGEASDYETGRPVVPADIPYVSTPLPFPASQLWFYTAGPHSAWGVGGPPSAVDFSPPPAEETGCFPSSAPVVAVAGGRVLWSRASGVAVDLEDDGLVQLGWTHVYSHLHPTNRVEAGARVDVGEVLGYPSCEGAIGGQTRVQFSRRYNGEWLRADHPEAPMILGDWHVVAGDVPYAGWLTHATLPARRASPDKVAATNGVAALPTAP